jgi:hypothetical protein
MNVSCARCPKVLALEFTVGGSEVDEDEDPSVDVAENAGAVLFVCKDCLTGREMWERACRSAAAMLDACEEGVANLDMIFGRIPAARENPEFKARYASMRESAETARTALETLLAHGPPFESE